MQISHKILCLGVEKHQDVKMSAGNLAVVIAPNLLWTHTDDMRWVEAFAGSAIIVLVDHKVLNKKKLSRRRYFSINTKKFRHFFHCFGPGSAVTTFQELKRLGGRL